MSSYGGKELASAFRTVRKNTIQVAEDIPEEKYSLVAAPEVRSVARMLTHIAMATRIWEEVHKKQLTTLEGFDFFGMMDRFTVTEPDGKTRKSRFERLLSAKEHEMHHRAQLMLIERQLGIVPHLTREFEKRVAQMRAASA